MCMVKIGTRKMVLHALTWITWLSTSYLGLWRTRPVRAWSRTSAANTRSSIFSRRSWAEVALSITNGRDVTVRSRRRTWHFLAGH